MPLKAWTTCRQPSKLYTTCSVVLGILCQQFQLCIFNNSLENSQFNPCLTDELIDWLKRLTDRQTDKGNYIVASLTYQNWHKPYERSILIETIQIFYLASLKHVIVKPIDMSLLGCTLIEWYSQLAKIMMPLFSTPFTPSPLLLLDKWTNQ